jgi:hypothetical protein
MTAFLIVGEIFMDTKQRNRRKEIGDNVTLLALLLGNHANDFRFALMERPFIQLYGLD